MTGDERTIGYLEILVERLALELRTRRVYPRSAGAHVRFPEDLARERRRRERFELLGYLLAMGTFVLLVVLVGTPPPTP